MLFVPVAAARSADFSEHSFGGQAIHESVKKLTAALIGTHDVMKQKKSVLKQVLSRSANACLEDRIFFIYLEKPRISK